MRAFLFDWSAHRHRDNRVSSAAARYRQKLSGAGIGTENPGVPSLFVVDAVEQAVLCNDAEVAIGLNRS
ncbi:hypothetical protein [Pseudomonas aeruginosa]|uniref:hypothetical protein n=1 Tax=Pseudomonas aeruginosa TaxID=287 RepID=UPI0034E0A998